MYNNQKKHRKQKRSRLATAKRNVGGGGRNAECPVMNQTSPSYPVYFTFQVCSSTYEKPRCAHARCGHISVVMTGWPRRPVAQPHPSPQLPVIRGRRGWVGGGGELIVLLHGGKKVSHARNADFRFALISSSLFLFSAASWPGEKGEDAMASLFQVVVVI